MKLVFAIFVSGDPKPQGSKKLVPAGRPVTLGMARQRPGAYWIGPHAIRPAVAVEAVKGLKEWRHRVTAHARAEWLRMRMGAKPLDGSVIVSMVFTFTRPKSHLTTRGAVRSCAPSHPGKPDLDKLVRAVGDALTSAEIWHDDSQVIAYQSVTKRYGTHPGVQIAIYTAPTTGPQQPLPAVERARNATQEEEPRASH